MVRAKQVADKIESIRLKDKAKEVSKDSDYWNERYIRDAKRMAASFELDPEEEKRKKDLNCKRCYYSHGRLAGQAFTDYKCRICDKENSHSNTAVPKICPQCSATFNLCVECGGSI